MLSLQAANPQASTSSWTRATAHGAAQSATLEQAQRFFYNGDYDRAAAATDVLCAARPDELEACELRTASLLFQIKKALGQSTFGRASRARASMTSSGQRFQGVFAGSSEAGTRSVLHATSPRTASCASSSRFMIRRRWLST